MTKHHAPAPQRPAQRQRRQPGSQTGMEPRPHADGEGYRGSGKLAGRAALITGGDSGIGRAAAVCFAKEGADVAIVYRDEHRDAKEARRLVEAAGCSCLLIPGDVGDERFCRRAVTAAHRRFGRLDILVSNAAEQHPREDPAEITTRQLERTFRTNVFACFHLVKAALPLLKPGAAIVITTSVTAYRGSDHLIDYAASKGALVALTRSLSQALVERGIRVNAVAPGPVWTPLIPATFPPKQVAEFGSTVPMKRAGQPDEIGPCYVFLAGPDSSYMTGQVLHPNGGEIING
jgi:NAD(P)-dependent dehydrogenase (short-subunit alcohol dehydrogenase family)